MACNCLKVGGCNCNEQQNESYQGVLTHRELWKWLIETGISRLKIDGQPKRVLLSL